jgi:DNA-binding transcriptional regulator of glucitol operon
MNWQNLPPKNAIMNFHQSTRQMEQPDFKLIQQHSNSIENFFAKHNYYLERINETHLMPYAYAQFLVYNQEINMYRELQMKFTDFYHEGHYNINRLFNALKNIASGSGETEFFEYVLAMVIMTETTQVINHSREKKSLLYIQETRLSGMFKVFEIKQYPISAQNRTTIMGVTLNDDPYATQKLKLDQQTHFLSHILRSHRQLN